MTTQAQVLAAQAQRTRFTLIDVARGVAIVAMIVYHLFWDLSYFRLIGMDISIEPGWVAFQHTIVATFLLLVGFSLVLAHGKAINWRSFRKRLAILVGAALAVTLATYLLFPESFVFFGILHAIALFSLLALIFLRLPIWSVFLAAAFFILLPALFQSPFFTERAFAWIGLWTEPPPANDLVPIFPWAGFVVFGVGVGRIVLSTSLRDALARFEARSRVSKFLAFCGRWSLLIYLLHQPLLLGVIYPIAMRATPEPTRAETFAGSCQSSCVATSGRAGFCQAYCACALDAIERDNLWGAINAIQPSARDRQSIADLTTQCSAVTP
jgi:uncharacterized membrane protein